MKYDSALNRRRIYKQAKESKKEKAHRTPKKAIFTHKLQPEVKSDSSSDSHSSHSSTQKIDWKQLDKIGQQHGFYQVPSKIAQDVMIRKVLSSPCRENQRLYSSRVKSARCERPQVYRPLVEKEAEQTLELHANKVVLNPHLQND